MVPTTRHRSALAALLAVTFVVLGVAPASAATTLQSARVDAQPGGGSLVSVQFLGSVPKYSVVGSGTAEVAVIFTDTVLAQQVPPTIAGTGPASSVTLAQTGTSSSIALHLAAPTPVQIRVQGGLLLVRVAPTSGAPPVQVVNAQPAAATGLGAVTEVVYLKYADISEVAGVLVAGSSVASNDNFSPQSTNIGTGSIGGSGFGGGFGGLQSGGGVAQQSFGGTFGQQGGLAQRVNDNIAVDRRLNAIVLTGPADVVAQLKAVIAQIDVPVKSVILETEIVELTDSASKDIGVDFSANGGVLGSGSYTIKNLQTGQGQLGLQGNIFAQVMRGNGKVLAKPRILAQSGSPASILTGDAIPITTQVIVTGQTGLTSQQVNYVNVGVSLQIQPRVSDDGYVTSHIYSEVSSVTSFTQGIPTISQRQATTSATVKDGESFVIGGLLQDNEIRNLVKLPFIGDIPLIGTFFTHVTTSRSQSNLYIVVTPHIVSNPANPPAQQILTPVTSTPPPAPPASAPQNSTQRGLPIVPAPVPAPTVR